MAEAVPAGVERPVARGAGWASGLRPPDGTRCRARGVWGLRPPSPFAPSKFSTPGLRCSYKLPDVVLSDGSVTVTCSLGRGWESPNRDCGILPRALGRSEVVGAGRPAESPGGCVTAETRVWRLQGHRHGGASPARLVTHPCTRQPKTPYTDPAELCRVGGSSVSASPVSGVRPGGRVPHPPCTFPVVCASLDSLPCGLSSRSDVLRTRRTKQRVFSANILSLVYPFLYFSPQCKTPSPPPGPTF